MIRKQEKQTIDFADFIREVAPYTKFSKMDYEAWATNAVAEDREVFEVHVKNITYEISASSIADYFGTGEPDAVEEFSDFGDTPFGPEAKVETESKTEPAKKPGTDRKTRKVS